MKWNPTEALVLFCVCISCCRFRVATIETTKMTENDEKTSVENHQNDFSVLRWTKSRALPNLSFSFRLRFSRLRYWFYMLMPIKVKERSRRCDKKPIFIAHKIEMDKLWWIFCINVFIFVPHFRFMLTSFRLALSWSHSCCLCRIIKKRYQRAF